MVEHKHHFTVWIFSYLAPSTCFKLTFTIPTSPAFPLNQKVSLSEDVEFYQVFFLYSFTLCPSLTFHFKGPRGWTSTCRFCSVQYCVDVLQCHNRNEDQGKAPQTSCENPDVSTPVQRFCFTHHRHPYRDPAAVDLFPAAEQSVSLFQPLLSPI